MPAPGARISLCVVARDEEAFIGPCLASAREVADEVLVLDSGSVDLTPRIAAAAGARVVRWRWRDDYAQAFEAMRRAASGDWILNLDADEVLDEASLIAVRRLVDSPEADAYLPLIRNYHYAVKLRWRPADPTAPASRGASNWSPSSTVRLFRNDPRYRYTGIVHHGVGASVVATGGRLAATDSIVVHHYGDLRLDKTALKADHYRALAERKVREEPGSGRAWIELGVILHHQGRLAEALDCFSRAASCGAGAGAWFHSGRSRFNAGDFEGAVSDLETALREDPHDDAADFDRADAFEALGAAHAACGRAALAEQAYREALGARPGSPAAANNLADLLARTGRTGPARALVSELLDLHPGLDAARCTLGNLLAVEGDDAAAELAYREALAIQPENVPARINLARVLARTGRPAAAAHAYRLAAEHIPSSGPQATLARYVPASARRRHRVSPPPGSSPILVSLVSHLGGGAGRVVLEVARALPGYRHLVLCADPGTYDGLGYRQALRRLHVPCHVAGDTAGVLEVLERTSAAGFVYHWWAAARYEGLTERCPTPQILIGHAATRMPDGPDAYVVLSAYHRRTQGHLPPERVHLIPNGTDLGLAHGGQGRRGRARVAMLSRLDPGKFPRRLLAYLPDLAACRAELVVAGRGARSFEIAPDLERVDWGHRVRFRGAVPWTRVPDFLATATVGLHLTETTPEVCSLSIIEMLAAGLPVVSQPRGCLPEMVVDGENGFLSESEEEVAERLRELLLDPDLRRRMGEAARERARSYDLRAFATSYRKLVAEVVR